MSHYTRVRTTLNDPLLLAAALEKLGLRPVEVHDTPQPLYGYQGDMRPERAEVVVRREHIGSASNDLGFARGADDTFQAIISSYDRVRYDKRWLTELTRAYGHAAALKFAETHGYEVTTDTLDHQGTRKLTLRRP